jgi:tetrahydromethanopterin S-methyltransferase subunit A
MMPMAQKTQVDLAVVMLASRHLILKIMAQVAQAAQCKSSRNMGFQKMVGRAGLEPAARSIIVAGVKK